MSTTRLARRAARSFVVMAAVATLGLGAAAVADPALAAKTPTRSTSSLQLVLLDSTDGQAHYGQRVEFSVSTTQTTSPMVSLTCSQNGTLVFSQDTGYYSSYPWPWTNVFTLSSSYWTGGSASCHSVLWWMGSKGKKVVGATLDFDVAA